MRPFFHVRSARVGGFTLAELAMVLVVFVVLTIMAVPSLLGLQGSQQDAAAARIRSLLIHAQTWALDIGTTTWVSVDPTNDSLEAFVEDWLNPGKAGRLPMPDPLSRADLVLQFGQPGVGIGSVDFGGASEVMFDAQGAPYDTNGTLLTADGTVVVSGGTTIRVTKNTGLITID